MAHENIAMNNLENNVTLFETAASADQINQLHADFIKLDCEGCEYELLSALDLLKVHELVLEYRRKPDPLLNVLRDNGFGTRLRGEIIFATRR